MSLTRVKPYAEKEMVAYKVFYYLNTKTEDTLYGYYTFNKVCSKKYPFVQADFPKTWKGGLLKWGVHSYMSAEDVIEVVKNSRNVQVWKVKASNIVGKGVFAKKPCIVSERVDLDQLIYKTDHKGKQIFYNPSVIERKDYASKKRSMEKHA